MESSITVSGNCDLLLYHFEMLLRRKIVWDIENTICKDVEKRKCFHVQGMKEFPCSGTQRPDHKRSAQCIEGMGFVFKAISNQWRILRRLSQIYTLGGTFCLTCEERIDEIWQQMKGVFSYISLGDRHRFESAQCLLSILYSSVSK